MIVGFDLDGTLDKDSLGWLAQVLLRAGHKVHIITGCFPEGDWQDPEAKRMKLRRLSIPFTENMIAAPGVARLHIIEARADYDHETRLREIGLRKGALCQEHGIEIFFDDSALYCELIPKMSGNTIPLQVH